MAPPRAAPRSFRSRCGYGRGPRIFRQVAPRLPRRGRAIEIASISVARRTVNLGATRRAVSNTIMPGGLHSRHSVSARADMRRTMRRCRLTEWHSAEPFSVPPAISQPPASDSIGKDRCVEIV